MTAVVPVTQRSRLRGRAMYGEDSEDDAVVCVEEGASGAQARAASHASPEAGSPLAHVVEIHMIYPDPSSFCLPVAIQ